MTTIKVVEQVVPGKRKRFNKNKKKAWRKKTNIVDVEEKLEEERREERYGGPLEEKKDEELMFLDVGFGETIKTEIKEEGFTLEYSLDKIPAGTDTKKKKVWGEDITLKASKKPRTTKPLRAHQFINGLPGARRPKKPRRNEGQLTAVMKRKIENQAKDPQITKKCETIARDLRVFGKSTRIKRWRSCLAYNRKDVWGEGDQIAKECRDKGVEESFVADISKYYGSMMKQRPVKAPRHAKTSRLDAIEAPLAGQSYNPSYKDHQNLLHVAVNQEKQTLKGERREEKYERGFPTKAKAPTEATWVQEMSEGLPKADDDTEKMGEEEEKKKGKVKAQGDNQVTVSSKPKNQRKTKQQKRKEKRQKKVVTKRAEKKEERIRDSNIFRIKTLKKEIMAEEELQRKRVNDRKLHTEKLKYLPKRLSKLTYQPEEVPVLLGNELPGSIRRICPAVELIEDRFKSMQRRSIVEVRERHKFERTHPLKKKLKRGHREAMAAIEKIEVD